MLSSLIRNQKYSYFLTLCKMNGEEIMPLQYTDISFTKNYNAYDSLTFSIPSHISAGKNENGSISRKTFRSPALDKIAPGSLILLDIRIDGESIFKEYFSIADIPSSSDESERSIMCTAYHQMLFNHIYLRGYDDTRKLYDYEGSVTNGVPFSAKDRTSGGIINYIIEYCLNNPNYSVSDKQWKVTFYDTALNDIFDGNVITSSQIASLRDNIGAYWKISHDYEDFSRYSGNVPTSKETGGDKETAYKWYSEMFAFIHGSSSQTVPTDGVCTEVYTSRLSLENKLNRIFEGIDYFADKLRLPANIEKLTNDTYFGVTLLSEAENLSADFKAFIDELLTENNIAVGAAGYIEKCMALLSDINENLVLPLLIFRGLSGKPPYRTLTIDGKNLTDTFSEIANSYLCVFDFDNVKREIKIYSRENPILGEESNITISSESLITNIKKSDSCDNIATRLYANGKNGTVISGISINGQRYSDDFSYFRSSFYMSDALLDALDKYDAKIERYSLENGKTLPESLIEYDSRYSGKNEDFLYIYDYYVKWANAEDEWEHISNLIARTDSDTEKKTYESERDALSKMIDEYESVMDGTLNYEVRHWCGTDYSSYTHEYRFHNAEDGYSSKMQKFFDNCQHILNQKTELQKSFLYKNATDENGINIFTDELLGELENFIYESDITVDTISDPRALLYYAQNYIKHLSKIPTTIDISLADILSNKNYSSLWERINKTGGFIMLSCPSLGLKSEYFRLMSYTHSPLSGELSLHFSNTEEIKDAYNSFIKGVVKKALDLSDTAEKYRSEWEEYTKMKNTYLCEGSAIDAEINGIVSGNKPIIGKGGIIISAQSGNAIKQLADGLYCPAQSASDISSGASGTAVALGSSINIIDHPPTAEDLRGDYTVHIEYSPTSAPVVSNDISSLFASSNVYAEIPAVSGMRITPAYSSIRPGESIQLTCSEESVSWSASSGSISSSGLFTSSGLGNVEITARSTKDPSKYAKASVSVKASSKLYLFNNSLTVASGGILKQIHQSGGGSAPQFYFAGSINRSANVANASIIAIFKNKIDVSSYSTLKMHFASTASSANYRSYDLVGYVYSANEPTNISSPTASVTHYENGSNYELSFSLPQSGEYYLGVYHCTGSIAIDRLWLE